LNKPIRSLVLVVGLLSVTLGIGQNAAVAESSGRPSTPDEIERDLKRQWELHPGPLLVDAHHWGFPKVVSNENEQICDPSLELIAEVEGRRYVRVGRADVFARLTGPSTWRQAGTIGSMWDFVASRSSELMKGLDIRTLSSEEREVMMHISNGIPAVQRQIIDRQEGELMIFPTMSWTVNGESGGAYFNTHLALRRQRTPAEQRTAWMEPRPPVGPKEDRFDFKDGKLLSLSEIAMLLYERGFIVRYDARLSASNLFLKGEFEKQELLESLAEVVKTVPFFVQDRRAIQAAAKVKYVEITKALLLQKGVPDFLVERIDAEGNLRATQQELLQIPNVKHRYGAKWGDANDNVLIQTMIHLGMDTGDDWVYRSSFNPGIMMGAMGILSTGVKPG
jgi:hypothetical protein